MTREQALKELAEEFRVNSHLRHRMGIQDGMEVTLISELAEGDPVGVAWQDKDGIDFALQLHSSGD